MPNRCSSLLLTLCALSTGLQAQTYKETDLYSFTESAFNPSYGLIQASDGNFYGVTEQGGTDQEQGVFFRITPAGTYTVLHVFCQQGANGTCTDGTDSYLPVEGPDGNFYGIASFGQTGTYSTNGNGGNVYRITPSGQFTVLYNFCSQMQCTDGYEPRGGIIFGSDGNLYGTAGSGGANGYGNIFRISTKGSYTDIYDFCPDAADGCPDGFTPANQLVQSSDGTLYGITAQGGTNGRGTLYNVSLGGAFTVLASFPTNNYSTCSDDQTCATLVEGPDGLLYGGIPYGTNQAGEIYRYKAGQIEPVYNFCSKGTEPTCADGDTIASPLIVGSDNNFYGTTTLGGAGGEGTFFRLTTAGALTTLYTFCPDAFNEACNVAAAPDKILQAANGSFYGTSSSGGGELEGGTVFELSGTTTLTAPIQLTLSSGSAVSGASVTASYKVAAAYSASAQNCFAYATVGAAVTALGPIVTKFSAGAASGSITFPAPQAAGSYVYGVTCGGGVSGTATGTVTKSVTAATLSITPNPASIGQTVTLTANVRKTTGAGTPGGTVTFSADGEVIGTVPVNSSGTATLSGSTASFSAGSYPVVATYSGDTGNNSSASPATTFTLKVPAIVSLKGSTATVTPPGSVTFTATVKRGGGASGTPTGTVSFYADGSTSMGMATLNGSGVATLTASSNGVPPGNYSVTATYQGDTGDGVATSPAVSIAVQ